MSRIAEADRRRRFGSRTERDPHSDGAQVAFVAVADPGAGGGEIVGEIRAHRYPNSAAAELGLIVRSDMKRRGIGRALMQVMIDYARKNSLELLARIAPSNAPMIGLGERCGMEIEHRPGTRTAVAYMDGARDAGLGAAA